MIEKVRHAVQTPHLFDVGFVAVVISLCLLLWSRDLTTYPPGLHYDEAIDLWGGSQILQGNLSLYITRGWGRETLFYYPLALMLSIVPNNVLALKSTAILCSLGILASVYWLLLRHVSRTAAISAILWYSTLYWTLYLSRSGIRGIIFPLMVCLVSLLFWRAWHSAETRHFIIAGVALGLTWYSYQPARFLPFLFIPFFGYAWWLHRDQFRKNQRGILLFSAVALLFALPLIYVVQTGLNAESVRAWTIEPYTRMLAGDFSLVWENIVNTAKLFTFSGDPLVSYNVPNRPMFVPAWTSLFFYGGLLYALYHWRTPFYAYLLLWFVITLSPTILTVSAPNHIRASGALPVICIFAALAVAKLWEHLPAYLPRNGVAVALVAVLLVGLGQTVQAAQTDYFEQWQVAKSADWERNYNTRIGTIVQAIQQDDDTTPVLLSTHSIEDAHPTIVGETLERPEIVMRWVDTGFAFAMPAGEQTARLFVASDRWLHGILFTEFFDNLEQVAGEPRYSQFLLTWPTELAATSQPVTLLPLDEPNPATAQIESVPLPVVLKSSVQLDAYTGLEQSLSSDENIVDFITWWTVQQPEPGRSVKLFAHLIDAGGNVVAQEDALGYPVHTWRSGDRFAQAHQLRYDETLPNGIYWVQLGIYERETGQRWLVDQDGIVADRVVLGQIEIKR